MAFIFFHINIYAKLHILGTVKFLRSTVRFAIVAGVFWAFGYFVVIPAAVVYLMPNEIRLTADEVEQHISVEPHEFVVGKYNKSVAVDGNPKTYVDLKLFGLFPIKRVSVDVLPYENLIAGGVPIGFVAKTDGVVVLQDGRGYKRGDVITRINGAEIGTLGDLERHLGEKRLGVWVKEDTSGVGMLTYINPENNNFAALGHKLVDHETAAGVDLRSGDVYACNVVGIDRTNARKIGSIESTLRKGDHGVQGNVLSSNDRGIYGCLGAQSVILDWCKTVYPVASRFSVKKGKCSVLLSLDGETVNEYEAKIVSTRFQKNKQGKGMIIKITDKRLLEETGGIVHGMSGSPIIQNGHLIGAVTHVITGDVTKGYGIYIDFMLP